MNKKLILFPIVAMMLVGCNTNKPASSQQSQQSGSQEPSSQPQSSEPARETGEAVITAAVSGYTDEGDDPGYLAEAEAPVAVDVLSVTWGNLGFYGHDFNTGSLLEAGGWLQFRLKNGNNSELYVESSKEIKEIKIVLPECKQAYANNGAWDAKFGTDNTYAAETIAVNTAADVKEYTVTPTADNNKFFCLAQGTGDSGHTHYAKSITVVYYK